MFLLRQQSGGNGRWHVNPFLQRTSSGMWEEDRLLQEEEEEYLDVSIRSPARQAIIQLCCQKRPSHREGIYFVSAHGLTRTTGNGVFQSKEVTIAAEQQGGRGGLSFNAKNAK
jgi:hypothetical protein